MVVLTTGPEGEQVLCCAGTPPGRLNAGFVVQHDFHIDMQDAERVIAAEVAGGPVCRNWSSSSQAFMVASQPSRMAQLPGGGGQILVSSQRGAERTPGRRTSS